MNASEFAVIGKYFNYFLLSNEIVLHKLNDVQIHPYSVEKPSLLHRLGVNYLKHPLIN